MQEQSVTPHAQINPDSYFLPESGEDVELKIEHY